MRVFELESGDTRIGFNTDDNHRVIAIWIECPVPNYRDYTPSMVAGHGTIDHPHRMSMPLPPQMDSLRATLQYIESLGSFWLGLRRVGWSNAEARWIPESDEERRDLSIFALSQSLSYPDRPIPFRQDTLARLLANRDELSYLVIPMSFVREGDADFRAHRYVSAYYNFYFFLEDLYGRGKTKNSAVRRAFEGSEQLRTAVRQTYDYLERPEMERNRRELRKVVEGIGCEYSPRGLVGFLVMVRGELHHFSQRSSRPKGHPLNQMQWRAVAFFGMSICMRLIALLANGTPPDSFAR